jgi:hypothetical protein
MVEHVIQAAQTAPRQPHRGSEQYRARPADAPPAQDARPAQGRRRQEQRGRVGGEGVRPDLRLPGRPADRHPEVGGGKRPVIGHVDVQRHGIRLCQARRRDQACVLRRRPSSPGFPNDKCGRARTPFPTPDRARSPAVRGQLPRRCGDIWSSYANSVHHWNAERACALRERALLRERVRCVSLRAPLCEHTQTHEQRERAHC